ncbi:putative G-protein coupled receptor 25 [Aplochiton taeniatus]
MNFNVSECSSSNLPFSHIYLPIFYFLMFFTGFLGNLFVIVVVGRRGKRRGRLVDTFVVNLALADLVFVLTLPLWAISANQLGHWNFGNLLCKISSYIIAVNRFSNVFFLTCMSIDRYLAVVRLMDSRFLRSSQCVRLTCAVVWLISLALGAPALVHRNVQMHNNEPICLDDEQSSILLGLSLTTVFLTFILPVLIILICYCSILTRLQKHGVSASNPRTEARRRHSFKMVFTIIMAFVVSWLPFNVFKIILISYPLSKADLSCYHQTILSHGLILSCCLAFLNSCVNPCIYYFLDHHFRHQAENLWLSCIDKNRGHPSYNSSTSFSNNSTLESFGTAALRGRLQSINMKI